MEDYAELQTVDPTHYTITREIARGGMGRIQLARDRRLGREVAVKEMLSHSNVATMRFEREARITAKLQHPSIVGVYEAGVWPSGDPFYAMRLVSGRSLDEAIAAATSFEQRLALLPNVLAVADAMAYAHGQNVIHRDLKPRNIVVGEFGETVVLDWGLAKELGTASLGGSLAESGDDADGSASYGSNATTAGEVLGTPAYMPPEQASDGSGVDARADVYSIGAMLYHVLAGAPPYDGDNAHEVIAALHEGPPVSIAVREPMAPSELVAIVDHAMARKQADRYLTARELAEDLRRFQTGQLVGAHRYSLRQLLRRWLRRHRTAVIATSAAAVVGISIGVFALTRIIAANHAIEQQRAIAVANERNTEDLLSFMLVDLQKKLAEVGRLDVLDSAARKATAYYEDRAGAGATDEAIHKSSLAHRLIAQVLHARNELAATQAEYEKQRVELEGLVARHPDNEEYAADLALNRLQIADLDIERGDTKRALSETRRAIADVEAALLLHPGDTRLGHVAYYGKANLAGLLESLGDLTGALVAHRESLAHAVAETDRSIGDRDEILAHTAMGRALRATNDTAGALAELERALAISEAGRQREPTNMKHLESIVIIKRKIGEVLADRKQPDAALEQEQTALALAKQLVERDPSNMNIRRTMVGIHNQIGVVLYERNDFNGALAAYQQAYDLSVTLAGQSGSADEQRGLTVMLNKLGDIKFGQRDVLGAVAEYRKALAIREQLVAKDPANDAWRRDLFYSHYLIGNALSRLDGRRAEAIAELRVALDIAEQRVAHATNTRSPLNDVLGIRVGIADTLLDGHDTKSALVEYTAARELAAREAARPGAKPDWAEWLAKIDAKLAAAAHAH